MAKLSDVAVWVGAGGSFEEGSVERVSSVEEATEGSLVFATDRRLLDDAIGSKAGGILASRRIGEGSLLDPRLMWVDDARLAFAVAAGRLARRLEEVGGIDARAVIEAEVTIGEGSSVGPGTVVGRGAQIGRSCRIMANVTIYPGTVLGDRVVVQSGAVLGSLGFGYVRDPKTGAYVAFPQQGRIVLEDDVEIGANTTVDRGALGETRIGRGTKIDNLVHIGHNCVIGTDVVIAAQTGISGSTVIGNGAVIGGQVGIGDHATIGEGVILGSASGVLSGKKLRGAGQVFWGTPAQPLRQYLRDLARFRRE